MNRARVPRDLHPVAWWVWAAGLAVACSFTTNPVTLVLLCGAAGLVVSARRSDQPWSRAFGLYLSLAAVIVALRVGFRILLGGGGEGTVLLQLPEIGLPDWVMGIHLLGPLTRESLLAGLYDGLRLGSIVVAVGAANALANPKRLLKSMPSALYEIGTALVVAITVLPQLAVSLRRVRSAQRLRGVETGRVRRLRSLLVPVLEDALDRSVALAAGMDARGYGRVGSATRAQRRGTGALMLAGLIGILVGSYAVLDRTAPRFLAAPMLLIGVGLSAAGLVAAGRRVRRTRYRPDPWRAPEWVVCLSGVAVAGLGWWVARHDLPSAYPALTGWPPTSGWALLAVLVATVPAWAAPPPVIVGADEAIHASMPGSGSAADNASGNASTSASGSTSIGGQTTGPIEAAVVDPAAKAGPRATEPASATSGAQQ